MPQLRRLAVDVILSALVPLVAVWVYEVSNLIVLASQGFSVTLNVRDIVPIGVVGVSSGVLSPLTKGLQVLIAMVLILPVGVTAQRKGLFISMASVVSTVSIYLASAYWEMLSLLSTTPMSFHVGVFIVGTSALALVLLRGLCRPLQLQHGWAPRPSPRPAHE